MRAYLLSRENGVVQIGRRVYVLPLRVVFDADRKQLAQHPYCEVKKNDWDHAFMAYHKIVVALSDPTQGADVYIPVKARC